MKHSVLLLATLFFCCFPAFSQEEGHHHEDLSANQLGTVHFPISCVTSVQQPFERGVALLHSFWYEEAQKQFAEIVQVDPHCAMAHWGLAMSCWHQLWNHPDVKTIKQGEIEVRKAKALHTTDDRERGYVAAMDAFYGGDKKRSYQTRADAYAKAMEEASKRHPEDREAAVLYALSLLASAPDGDTTFANEKKAAAVLEPIFAQDADHPGVAHYLIHAYDSPQMAQLGLPAARRYAQIAPASPHALHMPSHIFARLGLWQDDIDSNLASIAATRKTAAMHMGGEGHQFHAMDFLEYAYLQSGRETDAQALIKDVQDMPEMKDTDNVGYDPRVYALVALPARYALEMHHWADAAALTPVPGADAGDKAVTYWARAIGAARSGNAAQAREDAAQLVRVQKTLRHEKRFIAAKYVERNYSEAEAWADFADGKHEAALKQLRAVASAQEAEGDEPMAVPAREMVADMLLEMKQPAQALTEYEADLKFNPKRFDGLYGAARAAELAGNHEQANSYYTELVTVCSGSKSERPELSHARQLLAQK